MSKHKNNIKPWLESKLIARGISTSKLTLLTGNKITNASVFRWYNGTFCPTAEKMALICETLSKQPLKTHGEPPQYEDVPLEEGMAQFSARSYKSASKAKRDRV